MCDVPHTCHISAPPITAQFGGFWWPGDAMDTVEAIGKHTARTLLNRTMEALLSDSPIQQRLSEANASIKRLAQYKNEIPTQWNELKCIVNEFSLLVDIEITGSAKDDLSSAHELELSERLLTLYINLSGGSLIF